MLNEWSNQNHVLVTSYWLDRHITLFTFLIELQMGRGPSVAIKEDESWDCPAAADYLRCPSIKLLAITSCNQTCNQCFLLKPLQKSTMKISNHELKSIITSWSLNISFWDLVTEKLYFGNISATQSTRWSVGCWTPMSNIAYMSAVTPGPDCD